MADTIQSIAEDARQRYEASLRQLRSFIEQYPEFEKQVVEHDKKLNALETRFGELRQEISNVIEMTNKDADAAIEQHRQQAELHQTLAATESERKQHEVDVTEDVTETASYGRISFRANEATWHQYDHEAMEDKIPVHGHWLPSHVVSRRQSFENARDFVKDIGGRTVMLQPQGIEYVDSMECVLVEPMGKILSPNEFVSTGLVVCLEGCSHESNEMDDWGEVLKATKWLDAGLSFALPDVSCLAEASDVEQAVSAVMEKAGFQSCLLVGKGWGGQLASEIAARPRLCERVDGVLLIAPESPPPAECSRIEMPVMLVWAQNDEECPFVEIREWYELLESRRAPTWVSDPASGGHDFAELMKQGETAGQVGNFTVSCLIIGHIVKTLEEVGSNLDSLQLSDALARLCDELPIFLANQLRGDPEQGVAACISGEPSRIKRQMKELCSILKKWIREGMTEMASATE